MNTWQHQSLQKFVQHRFGFSKEINLATELLHYQVIFHNHVFKVLAEWGARTLQTDDRQRDRQTDGRTDGTDGRAMTL